MATEPGGLADFLPAGASPGVSVSAGRGQIADFAPPGQGGGLGSPQVPPGDSRGPSGDVREFLAPGQAYRPMPGTELGPGSTWPAQPDARLSPGAVTSRQDPDYDGDWHHGTVPHARRNVDDFTKARVAARYGVPADELGGYEIDHRIPLSAGGSNAESNLWPEPRPAADEKDQLEWKLYDQLKKGEITQDEAVRQIRAFKPSGLQGRLTDFMPNGEQRNRYLGQVLPGEKYQQAEGMVGHVLGALDFAGNVWRSALKGVIKGGQAYYDDGQGGMVRGGTSTMDKLRHQALSALMYGEQAFDKQRETTPSDLKDEFTEAVMGRKVRFGKDDGKFQWGDVGDIGIDLAVGILTDPLTYLTEGAAAGVRGSSSLARGAAEAAAGIKSAEAARYGSMMTAGRAGVGALMGYGSADKEAPWYEKAALALGGGVVGAKMPAIGAAVRRGVEEGGDALSNAYAVATRGPEFENVAQASRVANSAMEKARGIANWIRNGRLEALQGLNETEREAVTDVMHELKNQTVAKRNSILDRSGMKQGFEGYDEAFNQATVKANDFAREIAMPTVIDERFGSNPELKAKVIDAVNRWADHNENVMGRMNQMVYGRRLDQVVGAADGRVGSIGVPGLSFHVDDVGMARKSVEASGLLDLVERPEIQAKMRSTTMTDAAERGLTPDQSYAVYAERFAKHFLDDQELEAAKLMRAYRTTPAKQGVVRGWETGLKAFDAMTSFAKANMLYFSTSWLRTQFFDNMSKAFVEGGVPGLARSAWDATAGSVTSQLGKDVRGLLRGDVSHLFTNQDLKEAMQLGIIHDGMYKSLSSDATRDFLYAGDSFKRNVAARAYKEFTEKALGNPIVKTISSVGSYMEGAGRMATYKRVRDALVESGVSRDVAMKVAAQKVEQTFFNYSNVTMFENAVAKRLMPFYTFYSKNLPYWARAAMDPTKVGRVAALDKVRQVIGTTPTEKDNEGMTPYIRQNAPRKLGKDDQGNTRYLVSPVDPRVEALKMIDPKNLVETLKERGNPLIKTGYELATGRDTFTDDKLLPSESPKGRKYLFSRGFGHLELQRVIDHLTGANNSLGVHVDARGNPYTTSDKTVVGDRLLNAVFPHGFIDQAASAIGKNAVGKEAPGISAMNRLNPYQTIAVSPEFQSMARKRNAEKEGRK